MMNESDGPSPNGVAGMPEFTMPEKSEQYPDAAGNVLARIILEFDG